MKKMYEANKRLIYKREAARKGSFFFELLLIYFKPSVYINELKEINLKNLKLQGTKLIICDLDNTLVPHFTKFPNSYAKNFIQTVKDEDLEIVLISNNSSKRVSQFANLLGVEYISNAQKPFTKKIKAFINEKKYKKSEVVMIGDMIIMDILAANFLKMESILVRPIMSYNSEMSNFLNWFERNIFKRLQRNNLLLDEDNEVFKRYSDEYDLL